MQRKTIHDIDVQGKRVLVRVDFNVPLDDQGNITDDTRIRAALPTFEQLLEGGAALILVSHLGRPDGVEDALRLDPVAARLEDLLKRRVQKVDDCIGPVAEKVAERLQPGDVLVLEDVRFYKEEAANDTAFAE